MLLYSQDCEDKTLLILLETLLETEWQEEQKSFLQKTTNPFE